ncbi:sigma factor-like helix-turn-helix DNA-binding protein [Streptomyces sp. NPDC001219]
MTHREQAATTFDHLHTRHAAALTQQAYLLTGRPELARRAVERGFRLAWLRWPEVAVDPDPAGWVRAAVYEYALTPWHRWCPGLRPARAPRNPPGAAGPPDGVLAAALLSLPAPYRRALLLHDGLGLGLDETAAEIEASVPATAGRLAHARERIAALLPELGLAGRPPERQGQILRAALTALPAPPRPETPAAGQVRSDSERGAQRTTRAVFGAFWLFALVLLVTMAVTPGHYTPRPKQPLATAPHPRAAPPPHREADDGERRERARERRNAAARERSAAARERRNAARERRYAAARERRKAAREQAIAAARERRNAAREQGNAAVRKRLREARLAPEPR